MRSSMRGDGSISDGKSGLRRRQHLGVTFCGHGQVQHEHRSALRLIVAGNLAAMILYYSIDCAQAQACALADWLGRIKRVEHPMRFSYARSVVRELDHHFLSLKASADLKHSAARFFESLETDEIAGYEALLRWEHETRGTITPAVFIPVGTPFLSGK